MGKRKLRLSHKKNYECKKYQLPDKLMIKIPISFYYNATKDKTLNSQQLLECLRL